MPPKSLKTTTSASTGLRLPNQCWILFTVQLSVLWYPAAYPVSCSLQWREVDFSASGSMALIVLTHFLKHSSVTEAQAAMGSAGRLVFKHPMGYWNQLCSKARAACGALLCSGAAKRQLCSEHVITRLPQRLKYYGNFFNFPLLHTLGLCRLPICFISTALLLKGNITWKRVGIMLVLAHG